MYYQRCSRCNIRMCNCFKSLTFHGKIRGLPHTTFQHFSRASEDQGLFQDLTCLEILNLTRRVRPPNGGRNEANCWETGSEYSSGETYTAAAMRAAGWPRRVPARRPAPAWGLTRPAGPRWPLYAGIYQRRSRRIG